MHAPFDAADYVTRRGHQLVIGDDVVVKVRNAPGIAEGTIVELRPRHVGDVADVVVLGPAWAYGTDGPVTSRIQVNAVNVEVDTDLTAFRPYVSPYGAHPVVAS